MSDSLRPKATLANATRDLFSLSGEHRPVMLSLTNEAIDLAPESEPPARDSQASLIFSLQELSKKEPREEQQSIVDRQLWEMKVETPLFGTANDAALLAAPALDPGPGSSPMTVAHSRTPEGGELGYLWWMGGIASTVLLGAAVWWGVTSALRPAEPEPAAIAARVAEIEPAPPPALEAKAAPSEPEPPAAASAPEAEAKTLTRAVEPPSSERAAIAAEPARPAPTTKKKRSSGSKKPKSKKQVAAPQSGPKFDKSAAKSALSGAARRASECNMPGAAGGKGAVVLTFGPDGRVKSARLSAGRFQGTAIGTCVLSEFRRTKVPAFSGKPVTVKKSFRIR